MRLFRYRGLFANRDCCNNLLGTVLCVQTPVPCCSTPTITPTWTQVPAGSPTSTPSLTPTPTPAVCIWNNHECNPICNLENWEGGEIWKQISTLGYKDIRVEFRLHAEGLSPIPHGFRPWGITYSRQLWGNYLNPAYRPYQFCTGTNIDLLERCPDAQLIEELFMVMYTIEYEPPYDDNNTPIFGDTLMQVPHGISKWTVARLFTRDVLLEDYGGSGKAVTLDFSMYPDVNNNEDFGLWFRGQLDATENNLWIDDIKVFAKRLTP